MSDTGAVPLSPSAPSGTRATRRVLLVLLLFSLVPALMLAWTRVQYEQSPANRTVGIAMDHQALVTQARNLGLEPLELLTEYQKLGVNAVAVYEDVVANKVQRGEVISRAGAELFAQHPDRGFNPSWVYLRDVRAGQDSVVQSLRERYAYTTRTVEVDGQAWVGWPVDINAVPAGPNNALIADLQGRGFEVVYRPYDHSAVKNVAADWPDVRFVAFNGVAVVGADNPERLKLVKERLGDRIPTIIDMNPQKGLGTLIQDHPAIRMFAIRPEWQDLLTPAEVASKFVLAARERNHHLLYVRPFRTQQDTEQFLTRVRDGLEKADLRVGAPIVQSYHPSSALRFLSLIGPLIALALLALSYPLVRLGALVALGTLALAVVVNFSSPFGAGALLAAVTFPALGFVMRRGRPTDWLIATAFSLVGVLFVAALGADRHSMLGLHPFRGVGLTLIVPLGLFALSLLPRQDIRKTITDLYNYPLKLGDVLIIMLGLAAIALIVLRRGNTPAVGVTDAESRVRLLLQDNLIRPRFKEIAGHPAAILGLSGKFPPYFAYLLLAGGVVAQASVLNTFSHFHTPFLISLQRVINGVAFGGVIGFLMLPLLAWGVRYLRSERNAAHAEGVQDDRVSGKQGA